MQSLKLLLLTESGLMNAVKIIFPKATNLLCRFHNDKKLKAKCKTLVGQKNAWDYVMEAWGSMVDCRYYL